MYWGSISVLKIYIYKKIILIIVSMDRTRQQAVRVRMTPILQMRKLGPERRVAQLPRRWRTPVGTCWPLNGHWSQ